MYYICKTKPNKTKKNPPDLEQCTLGNLSTHLLLGNRFFFLLRRSLSAVLSTQWTSLFCLTVCFIWHLASSTSISVPAGREEDLHLHHKGGACYSSPQVNYGERPAGHGRRAHIIYTDFVVAHFLSYVKHCSTSELWIGSYLENSKPVRVCSLMSVSKYFWWLALWLLPSFISWETSLGTGSLDLPSQQIDYPVYVCFI